MNTARCLVARFLAFVAMLACSVAAQDAGAGANTNMQRFSDVLGLKDNVTITPVAVANRDGETTAGIQYEFKRPFHRFLRGTELDLYLESQGTFVAEPDLTPETRLTHRLRLKVIDVLNRERDDYARYKAAGHVWRYKKHPLPEDDRKLGDLYTSWRRQEGEEREKTRAQIDEIWRRRAGHDLTFVDPLPDEKSDERLLELDHLRTPDTSFAPFVSLDVDLGAETNQEFTETQWVGSVQLRSKWPALGAPLDLLLGAIRGYETPVDYRNVARGPYLWGGVDFVDASDNDARKALTTDDQLTRVHIGAFYRGELFGLQMDAEPEVVAIEVEWRYYFEIDAPAAIEAAEQDETSWFRGTLLFPGNTILEYTDGRQPLDLTAGSRFFVGWRYEF